MPKNENTVDKPTEDVMKTKQQQHTGNHQRDEDRQGQPYGADAFGGTRAGAENVEPKSGSKPSSS
jgi:hypothetical protein